MCIIIHKPAGKTVPPEYLEEAARIHKDGSGAAIYAPGKKLRIVKTPRPGVELTREVNARSAECEVFFHFRMATHGSVDPSNTHPVQIPNTGFWLMHNGTIGGYGTYTRRGGFGKWVDGEWVKDADKDEPSISDTREFAEVTLADVLKIAPQLAGVKAFAQLVLDAAGSSNKFALLGPDKGYLIRTTDAGIERDGIWYSNGTAFPYVKPENTSSGKHWLTRSERRALRNQQHNDYTLTAQGSDSCAFQGGNCGCEFDCAQSGYRSQDRTVIQATSVPATVDSPVMERMRKAGVHADVINRYSYLMRNYSTLSEGEKQELSKLWDVYWANGNASQGGEGATH